MRVMAFSAGISTKFDAFVKNVCCEIVGHVNLIKKKGLRRFPLKYSTGGIRVSEKTLLRHYLCVGRQSCVAMESSSTHDTMIVPYTIFISLKLLRFSAPKYRFHWQRCLNITQIYIYYA